jgi:hypothetical protein
MNYKKLISIVLSLSVVAIVACPGIPQKPAETTTQGGSPITVKGKIEYMERLGGYFVHGLEPGGELFIVNQDPKALEDMMKSGKILTIEGRIVRGAEYLFIEKIDGQPYRGKQ